MNLKRNACIRLVEALFGALERETSFANIWRALEGKNGKVLQVKLENIRQCQGAANSSPGGQGIY